MADSEQKHGSINIDEIVEIGAVIPPGRYTVRMTSCDGKLSATAKPMLVVTYEVLQGEHEGMEATCFYSLTATVKNGKIYASGLVDLKKIFAVVGKPLPKGYEFELGDPTIPNSVDKAMAVNRKMFMEKVGQTRLEMLVVIDKSNQLKDKDTQQLRFRDPDGNNTFEETTNGKANEPIYGYRRTIVAPANRVGGTGQHVPQAGPAAAPGTATQAASVTSDDDIAAMLAT